MINEQGIAVNTPDLSRLYIISGRMMFDDEEEVMLVEADSCGEAEAAFQQHIAEGVAHLIRCLLFRLRPYNHCYQTGSLLPP